MTLRSARKLARKRKSILNAMVRKAYVSHDFVRHPKLYIFVDFFLKILVGRKTIITHELLFLQRKTLAQRAAELFYMSKKPTLGKRALDFSI